VIDDLRERAWAYFDAATHPETGLVLDRLVSLGIPRESRMSSIAATGYALSILPVLVETRRLGRREAEERAARTMKSILDRVPHVHGLCCHFVDWETGKQWDRSEYSTLDTAILLNGCIVCAAYFDSCARPCDELLERIEWERLLVKDRATGREILSYGIGPVPDEAGRPVVLPHGADRRSSENLMPYLIATGAARRPLDSSVYANVHVEYGEVVGRRILNPAHALFTSYYGLGWVDLRGLHDPDGIDYEANARAAALANRAYCRDVAARQFRSYRADAGGWWGLSAGDCMRGYDAKGPLAGDPDGMVWPTASVAALPWIEEELRADLPPWRASKVWPRVLGRFGLAPFSVDRSWVGTDIIGIDVGSLLLSLAIRDGFPIRKLWMSHPVAQRAVKRLSFSRP
jgi:hypothetical protein